MGFFFVYYAAGEDIVSHHFQFSFIYMEQTTLNCFLLKCQKFIVRSSHSSYLEYSKHNLSTTLIFCRHCFGFVGVCVCVLPCTCTCTFFRLTLMCRLPPKGCFHFLTPLSHSSCLDCYKQVGKYLLPFQKRFIFYPESGRAGTGCFVCQSSQLVAFKKKEKRKRKVNWGKG